MVDAYEAARAISGQPQVIIAQTQKGKGVSFMEGSGGWHGKAPNDEQLAQALKEIG
jgi:transketolase